MEKKRDLKLDILRIAAIVGVIVIHVAGNAVVNNKSTSSLDWWIANILDSLFRWCVPVFIMISGCLLLNVKSEDSISFYKKRVERVVWPLIFWSIIYILFGYFVTKYSTSINGIINNVIHGVPYYHLYFMFAILGLYLVTPFLWKIIKNLTLSQLLGLCLFIQILTFIWAFLFSFIYNLDPTQDLIVLTLFIPFIGYYLWGFYLYKINMSKSVSAIKLIIALLISALLIAFGTKFLIDRLGGDNTGEYLYNYFSPLVFVFSTIVFLLSFKLKVQLNATLENLVILLSEGSFGVYMIHLLILSFVNILLSKVNISKSTAIFTVLNIVLTLVISYAIVLLLRKVKLLRNIL